MKKFLAGLATCLMLFAWNNPVAFTETTKEKCDRLREEGKDLPPECGGPSLPNLPDTGGKPSTTPVAPTTSTAPPHEAWESPNAGGDSDSSKPDKPEKPEKPARPAHAQPEKDPKPSGSKKPSGSSSNGGKKPAGSDSSSGGGVSSNGSGRPDTVCAGEFCNPEDTLIGGVGSINDRYPNRNPGQGAATGSDVSGPTVRYPDVVKPADRNTPPENIGTVIKTDDGLAIRHGDESIPLDSDKAKVFKHGDSVDVEYSDVNGVNNSPEECAVAMGEVAAGQPISNLGIFAYESNGAVDGRKIDVNVEGSPYKEDTLAAMDEWNDAGSPIEFREHNRSNPLLKGPLNSDLSVDRMSQEEMDSEEYQNTWAYYDSKDDVIRINEDKMEEEKLTPEERQAVIAHELGHAMGMQHSCEEGSIMDAVQDFHDNPAQTKTPTKFDIAVLDQKYN